jgi:hypothetical protein
VLLYYGGYKITYLLNILTSNIGMNLLEIVKGLIKDTEIYLTSISGAKYTEPIPLLSYSTIGQHSRHFIEFFLCLVDQIQSSSPAINYDKRTRDVVIESDPLAALASLSDVIDKLATVSNPDSLVIEAEYNSPEGQTRIDTSLEREIMYNIEHTIHHLAIIKIGLKIVAPEIQLPDHFGVAPSTMKYRSRQEIKN